MKLNNPDPHQKAIRNITRIVKEGGFTYQQTKYLFEQVRKNCQLKGERSKKGAKEHLSTEEAMRLINLAYQQKSTNGLLMKVLLFTGARVNEFVNIEIQDIYFSEKKIYLKKTKGDKPRFVPIFGFYLDEMRIFVGERKEGPLFVSRHGGKYTTRRIHQIVNRYVKMAGIQKKITPHRLRATIATWLSEKGMPTEQIQMFLGHTKLETTQIYTQGATRQIGDYGEKLLLGKD